MFRTRSTRLGFLQAGNGLALALALAGWMVTPAFSMPPGKCCVSKTGKVVVAGDAARECPKPCNKACDKSCEKAETSSCSETCQAKRIVIKKGMNGDREVTCTIVVEGDDDPLARGECRLGASDDDLGQRLAELRAQLDKLSQELKELRRGGDMRMPPVPPVPPVPPLPEARPGFSIQRGHEPQIWIMKDNELRESGEGESEIVTRVYKLPPDKLEALTNLMVREDVPVLVSPGEGQIEVHATPAQQKVFEAFVNLIEPGSAECARHELKLRILGKPNDEDNAGCEMKGLLEGAFGGKPAGAVRWHQREVEEPDAAEGEDLDEIVTELNAKLLDRAEELRANAEELRGKAKELRTKARGVEDEKPFQARELSRVAAGIERKAKDVEHMARELEQKARSVREEDRER